MSVEFSDEAIWDLETLGDFVAFDNPARAVSFIGELRQSCFGLQEGPYRFAVLDGFEHLGYRRRVHGQYVIVYVVGDDRIDIVRILSSAVDFRGALLDD